VGHGSLFLIRTLPDPDLLWFNGLISITSAATNPIFTKQISQNLGWPATWADRQRLLKIWSVTRPGPQMNSTHGQLRLLLGFALGLDIVYVCLVSGGYAHVFILLYAVIVFPSSNIGRHAFGLFSHVDGVFSSQTIWQLWLYSCIRLLHDWLISVSGTIYPALRSPCGLACGSVPCITHYAGEVLPEPTITAETKPSTRPSRTDKLELADEW